jgi:hypothetical protein
LLISWEETVEEPNQRADQMSREDFQFYMKMKAEVRESNTTINPVKIWVESISRHGIVRIKFN